MRKRLLAVLLLGALLVPSLCADKRTDNIDVIVALDKSLSMERKVEAVKTWVNSYLIDQVIIAGDYFIVVAFYGKADTLISQSVHDGADKEALKRIVAGVKGDGRFTDIGNALDALKAQLKARENDGREKYVLLLTDGIQEAPPSSKYWSSDGKFNHEFLANTKTIQEKGWKIMILGIGTETAAKDLARELQSSYNEITGSLTLGSLTEKVDALFGSVEVQGALRVRPISIDGGSEITFSVKSAGLKKETEIQLEGIAAVIGANPPHDLLEKPLVFSVKAAGQTAVRIPVRFPRGMSPGSSSASLAFTFLSGQRFTPAEFTVPIVVKGWMQNNVPLLAGATAAFLAVVAAAVVLALRMARGKPLRFTVLVDDDPVGGAPVVLPAGREMYLNDMDGAFSLVPRRNARSVARLYMKERRLVLAILKPDRFPKVKDLPADARGRSFPMKSSRGVNATLKIRAAERAK
jgi:hypothetical protein